MTAPPNWPVIMHRLCAAPPHGQGRDPRDVAQWTLDQLACVTMGIKELQRQGGKIVRMSESEAMALGYIPKAKATKGSLVEAIKKGKVEIPEHLRNTAFHYGPLPGDSDYRPPRKN